MKAGDVIGRLTLLEGIRIGTRAAWVCLCECGSKKEIRMDSLKSGATVSCGCFSAEATASRGTKHGLVGTAGYSSWAAMMNRCYRQSHDSFMYYGARGITVCDRWHDAALFIEDMGQPEKGNQIDRINTDGNYEPANCKWSSRRQNVNNRRNTLFLEVNGVIKTASEWSEITGVPLKKIHVRLFRGWTHERAIQSTNFKLKENQSG